MGGRDQKLQCFTIYMVMIRKYRSDSTSPRERPSPPLKLQKKLPNMSLDGGRDDDASNMSDDSDFTFTDTAGEESKEDEVKKLLESLPSETPTWAVAIFSCLSGQMTDLKRSVNHSNNIAVGVSNRLNGESMKISQLSNRQDAVEKKLIDSDRERKLLTDRVNRLEVLARKDNLLFDGFVEEEDEDCLEKVNKVIEMIGLVTEDLRIVSCYRKGTVDENAKYGRPIFVKFGCIEHRNQVFERRFSLKGKKVSECTIFIQDDLPPEMERNKKLLRPIFTAAKKSTSLKQRIKFRQDRLVIDGREYGANELFDIPAPFNLKKECEREDSEKIAFFGKWSPLSNFHPCKFKVQGQEFNCAEQYLQHSKAMFFNDDETAYKIMLAKSPAKMTALGHRVKHYKQEDWEVNALEIVERGIWAKFSQNPKLAQYLLKTADKQLLEANGKGGYWGTTLSLKDPEVLSQVEYSGDNSLGKILTRVRNNLKNK